LPIRIPKTINVLPERFRKPLYNINTINTTEAQVFRQQQESSLELLEEKRVQLESLLNNTDPDVVAKAIEDLKLNTSEQTKTLTVFDTAIQRQADQVNKEIIDINKNRETLARSIVTAGLATAQQALSYSINTIGVKTGNIIKQERLQKGLLLANQFAGVGAAFLANPVIAATAAAGIVTNYAVKELTIANQRERSTTDNMLRLQLVGGISQRGNR
jgi:hypothetical protein